MRAATRGSFGCHGQGGDASGGRALRSRLFPPLQPARAVEHGSGTPAPQPQGGAKYRRLSLTLLSPLSLLGNIVLPCPATARLHFLLAQRALRMRTPPPFFFFFLFFSPFFSPLPSSTPLGACSRPSGIPGGRCCHRCALPPARLRLAEQPLGGPRGSARLAGAAAGVIDAPAR